MKRSIVMLSFLAATLSLAAGIIGLVTCNGIVLGIIWMIIGVLWMVKAFLDLKKYSKDNSKDEGDTNG